MTKLYASGATVKPWGYPQATRSFFPKGLRVLLPRRSGGSFTVYLDGNLYRIAGNDADALGKEPVEPPTLPAGASDSDVEELVWDQMRTCFDPEIPVNIVELGLIYECTLQPLDSGNRKVYIKMTLTAPGCGMGDILVDDVRSKVALVSTVDDVDVDLVFEPMWSYDRMSEAAKLATGIY